MSQSPGEIPFQVAHQRCPCSRLRGRQAWEEARLRSVEVRVSQLSGDPDHRTRHMAGGDQRTRVERFVMPEVCRPALAAQSVTLQSVSHCKESKRQACKGRGLGVSFHT